MVQIIDKKYKPEEIELTDMVRKIIKDYESKGLTKDEIAIVLFDEMEEYHSDFVTEVFFDRMSEM